MSQSKNKDLGGLGLISTCGIFVLSLRCVDVDVQKFVEITVPVLWLTKEIKEESGVESHLC